MDSRLCQTAAQSDFISLGGHKRFSNARSRGILPGVLDIIYSLANLAKADYRTQCCVWELGVHKLTVVFPYSSDYTSKVLNYL